MTLTGFDTRDRQMFFTLLAMTIRDRFLGSQLGRVWAILNPVMMLSIFSFVFTVVFPQRLPGSNSTYSYLIWLISGYGPWLAINEGLVSGAGSVIGSAGIIKNIAFKSELLPMVGAMMGLIPLTVSFGYLIVLIVLSGASVSPAWLFLPLVAFVQIVLVSGIGLFLSGITVFVRDTLMILPNILMMILFLSPVFFPITSFPPTGQAISYFNPVFILADSYRQPILNGAAPDLWRLCYVAVLGVIVFTAGLQFFRRLKPYFSSRL
ncbi:MAG TPA: ABC transporter permease [Caulobacterales bacterium]|nr:ABC transporter permease [Caulobacterales bacterium]